MLGGGGGVLLPTTGNRIFFVKKMGTNKHLEKKFHIEYFSKNIIKQIGSGFWLQKMKTQNFIQFFHKFKKKTSVFARTK